MFQIRMAVLLLLSLLLSLPFTHFAQAQSVAPNFDRVFMIVFENKNAADVMKYSFFKELANRGANLANMNGVAHPSQGNYIAMIAGDTLGVKGDGNVDLSQQHLGDLLESKGRKWKVYAEDYPGNCFTGKTNGPYARKHVPFISFTNVSKNKQRCDNIRNAKEFDADIQNRNLVDYTMYIPNLRNDGHDTNLDFSNKYLESKFGKLLRDPNFLRKTLVVITFDESESPFSNQIYTVLLGDSVVAGSSTSQKLNHISILKLIEDSWNLGNLGRQDSKATTPTGIWN